METQQPKTNKVLIIAAIIAAVLCCCCLIAAVVGVLTVPAFQEIMNIQALPTIEGLPLPVEPTAATLKPTPTTAKEAVTVRQWASGASASSEYGSTDWSAQQATGAPDLTECGDNPKAWASATNTGWDTLELTFEQVVIPEEVNIYISFTPSSVVQVEMIDTAGESHPVYAAEPLEMDCPAVLNIPINGAQFATSQLRITVDQSRLANWNEIDAVELVGVLSDDGTASSPAEPQSQGAGSVPDVSLPGISLDKIPAGSFYYEIAGSETAKVDGGTLQYQTTSAEYVLGLVSQDLRHAVSLFMPLDVKPGVIVFEQYDSNAATKNPTAAIFIGSAYYYAQAGGVLMIDSVKDGKISGTFMFVAVHESDSSRIVTVTGGFNQVDLR